MNNRNWAAWAWISCCVLATGATELISGNVLDQFKPVKGWHLVESVSTGEGQKQLKSVLGTKGAILLNGEKKGKIPYLFTKQEFGDAKVSLEFMLPEDSNAGLYIMGRYEVQIFDSFGKENVDFSDLGGIYQRWNSNAEGKARGYEGIAPMANAAKAPGEWQKIDVVFHAPRFNSAGEKVENARFETVHVNGQLVQENVSVTGPTRSNPIGGEAAKGPISIQGDHGPIAIRSFIVTQLSE